MIKAVVFDFWGTLAENGVYSPLKQTYNILRPRMNFSHFVMQFEDLVMTKEFDSPKSIFEKVLNFLRVPINDFIINKLIKIWSENSEKAVLYPEILDVIKELKKRKIKFGIITNTPSAFTEEAIERLGLKKLMKNIFYSYKEGILKTNSEMFDRVIKKLKVKKEELLMVGDSIQTDIRGAENAGVKAVLIDRKDIRQYSPKILSLTEVFDHL